MRRMADRLKGFLKMTGPYSRSAAYLAEHGYTDEYIQMLMDDMSVVKKLPEIAEGQALLAQSYLFRGELVKSAELFEAVGIEQLPKHLNSVFVNNYVLCLFLLDRIGEIKKLYREYHNIALAENTLVMRRTVALNEYANREYENAVTVLVKLLDEPDPRATLMADICIVKTFLALDMKDRAREIAELGFSRYRAMGDITAIVNRLENGINSVRRGKRK